MRTIQYLKVIVITAIMFSVPSILMAQFPPDPGGGPDVPIDGGLSILLGAGVGYVVKKGYDRRKKKRAEAEEAEK